MVELFRKRVSQTLGQLRRVIRVSFRTSVKPSGSADPNGDVVQPGDVLFVVGCDEITRSWNVITRHGSLWVRDEHFNQSTEMVHSGRPGGRVRP
jgi:hypothetical protein